MAWIQLYFQICATPINLSCHVRLSATTFYRMVSKLKYALVHFICTILACLVLLVSHERVKYHLQARKTISNCFCSLMNTIGLTVAARDSGDFQNSSQFRRLHGLVEDIVYFLQSRHLVGVLQGSFVVYTCS